MEPTANQVNTLLSISKWNGTRNITVDNSYYNYRNCCTAKVSLSTLLCNATWRRLF